MKISEKIYRLRTEYKLTQVQFGEIAGASGKAVSTWECGTKEPRVRSLQKICAHFHIDLNQFVDTGTDVYRTEILFPDIQNNADYNLLRIAGRDGFYLERRLTDEQIQALKMIINELPDADDL